MKESDCISKLRGILLENGEVVGEIEHTTGNYDDRGNLILGSIPTITTDQCEIGIYSDIIYFTFIISAKEYKKELFDALKEYKNVQIYPFKDFKKTLYPKLDFDYLGFENEINKIEYLQINFNDNHTEQSPDEMFKKYLEYKNIFSEHNIKVMDQLKNNLKS